MTSAEERAAAKAEHDRQHAASAAELAKREELTALAEDLAQQAEREDKAQVVHEIVHALLRKF